MLKKITCLLLVLFLAGCGSSKNASTKKNKVSEDNLKDVKVYFVKTDKKDKSLTFIPIFRKVYKEDNSLEGSIRELLLGTTEEERKNGISSEIPDGTRLNKIVEDDDEILIDFSERFLAGGGSASVQIRYLQVYKTLEELAPGKKFFLNIEGKEPKTISGEGLEVSQPLKKIEDYTQKFEKTEDVQP